MKTRFLPIYQRELRSLFYSPLAYLVLFIFVILAGYFWSSMVMGYSNYSLRVIQQSRMGGGGQLKLMDYMVAPVLGNLAVTFLFLLPLLTMRSFSEEKKSGTIEMLFTYPVSDFDILLGKYLSSLTLLAVMVGVVALLPLTVADLASFQWPIVISAFLGLFLVGAAFTAVGTLTSTFSENQVVAAAFGFGGLLLLFVVGWVAQSVGGGLNSFLTELSVMNHFQDMLKGLINLKDLSYFAFIIVFCLFSTLRVLESKKWR